MKVENSKNTKTNKKSLLTGGDKRNAAFVIVAVNTCDVWRDKEFKLSTTAAGSKVMSAVFYERTVIRSGSDRINGINHNGTRNYEVKRQ